MEAHRSLLVTEGAVFLAPMAAEALSDKEVSKESAFKAQSMGAKKQIFLSLKHSSSHDLLLVWSAQR